MKINNVFRVGLLLTLVVVTTGCRFEEADVFDTSANLRQEAANKEIKNILCSASEDGGYGWTLQYFVAGTDDASYPGFNLFCQFYNSGKVIIGGDHAYMKGGLEGVYKESTSYYEMNKNEANTLAFTTWNDVLTPFVNPDDEGEGMHGDCDLVVMTWDENELTFRGTRHSARSRLVRLDRSIDQYRTDYKAMQSKLKNTVQNPYIISNGSSSSYMIYVNSGRLKLVDRISDPLSTSEKALVFTPDGFRTETTVDNLDNAFSFQEFVYDESKDLFVEKNDNNITFDVAYKNASEFFVNSMSVKMYNTDADKVWNFNSDSDISENLKNDIAAIKSANGSLKNHKFYIGYDRKTSHMTITLSCKLSTSTKKYTYLFDYAVSDGVLTLSNPTLDGTMDTAGKKIQAELDAFMTDFAKAFSVQETDTKWSRQTMKLSSSDGSTYVNLN